MNQFEWSDQYAVGIGPIDNDHRGLFDAMNELQSAVKQRRGESEIELTIGFLVRYVKDHFEREEQLMREHGYPGYDEHKAVHDKLTRQVLAMQKLYEADRDMVNLEKLVEFLRGWLIRHILGTDMDYVPYVQGSVAGTVAAPETSDPVEVTVSIPADKADVLRRCAEVLTEGGSGADALEKALDPVEGMSLEEAEKIAGFVMA